MATRHNIVFLPIKHFEKDEKGNYPDAIKFNKDGKLNMKCIRYAPKVYVHWDGYPSGALPILRDFLNCDGARARMHDPEYLSAYYIAFKIIHDFGHNNLKSLDDFRGIGIETRLSDWADFTYIIKGEATNATETKFVIYILDYNLKLLGKIENINNLEDYENCEWWY